MQKESSVFWDIMQWSPLRANRRFGGTYHLYLLLCLPPAFTLVSCLAYFSTLKIETICSFETSVGSQWTTWRYIPEDGTFHNHRSENLTSYTTWCRLPTSNHLIYYKVFWWSHVTLGFCTSFILLFQTEGFRNTVQNTETVSRNPIVLQLGLWTVDCWCCYLQEWRHSRSCFHMWSHSLWWCVVRRLWYSSSW
jgi:hypothetical protein